VIEAVVSATPVIASRIDGNVGLLGADYRGYFEWGDAEGLATLLERLRDEPAMLAALAAQCAPRAPLFNPEVERRTLLDIVAGLRPALHGTST
jgi:glycosyltransferase involved in cell wall biosynthesis